MIPLKVTSINEGVWTVLLVAGEIDLHTVPELKASIDGHLGRNTTRLALDLSEVDFIDSSGLSALLAGNKRCAELGGSLVLLKPTAAVMRAVEVTGLDKVFSIHSTLDEASSSPASSR